MPFNRPTLVEIIERQITDVDSRLAGVSAQLRRSLVHALVRAEAGVAHGLHGHLAWLSDQIIPDTAETDMLDRHGSWWGVNRLAAVAATGSVSFTGTDGAVILAGTVIQRQDATQYSTDAEGTIVAGTVDVAVTALVAGSNGNASAGSTLELVSAIAGVDSALTVDVDGLVNGADIETDDGLRARLRTRVQQPPHGGASHDYEQWAKQIAGVTRVWSFPLWLGPGTVGVFFVRDDDATAIPDAAEVAEVQAHIDSVRPVTATVTVIAPIAAPQDLTIQLSPNTAELQAAITAELAYFFDTASQVEDGNGSGTLLTSQIIEPIRVAAGDADVIVVTPAADITLTTGQLATLGTITYQAIP